MLTFHVFPYWFWWILFFIFKLLICNFPFKILLNCNNCIHLKCMNYFGDNVLVFELESQLIIKVNGIFFPKNIFKIHSKFDMIGICKIAQKTKTKWETSINLYVYTFNNVLGFSPRIATDFFFLNHFGWLGVKESFKPTCGFDAFLHNFFTPIDGKIIVPHSIPISFYHNIAEKVQSIEPTTHRTDKDMLAWETIMSLNLYACICTKIWTANDKVPTTVSDRLFSHRLEWLQKLKKKRNSL